MFQAGDHIIYGNTGVCRVEEVCRRDDLPPDARDTLFYRLMPLHGSCTIYIPVDSPVFMRPVVTRAQALDLIARIPAIREDDFQPDDPKLLAAHYKDFFRSHACEDLIQLIKTVYHKNQTMAHRGRRPPKTDNQYMQQAEALLNDELGVALDIPSTDVPDFIAQTLEQKTTASNA